jgi:hypothetical protein
MMARRPSIIVADSVSFSMKLFFCETAPSREDEHLDEREAPPFGER